MFASLHDALHDASLRGAAGVEHAGGVDEGAARALVPTATKGPGQRGHGLDAAAWQHEGCVWQQEHRARRVERVHAR